MRKIRFANTRKRYSIEELIELSIIQKDSFGYYVVDRCSIIADGGFVVNRFKYKDGKWFIVSGDIMGDYFIDNFESYQCKLYTPIQ